MVFTVRRDLILISGGGRGDTGSVFIEAPEDLNGPLGGEHWGTEFRFVKSSRMFINLANDSGSATVPATLRAWNVL